MPAVVSSFLGSRKDTMMALIIGIGAAMLYLGKLDQEGFESIVKWIGGGWLGARGLEDAMTKSAALKTGAHTKPTADD